MYACMYTHKKAHQERCLICRGKQITKIECRLLILSFASIVHYSDKVVNVFSVSEAIFLDLFAFNGTL